MKEIQTERLILSLWKESDAEALYEYASNPDVGPHAGWKPHSDVLESLKIIKSVFIPNNVWAITIKQNGKVIGSVGLEPDKKRVGIKSHELGFALSKEFWGRGVMTEAAKAVIHFGFSAYGLDLVSVCTAPSNKRSQSVIQKCGFIYEGTLRDAYKVYDGSLRDTKCYSILKEEWEF